MNLSEPRMQHGTVFRLTAHDVLWVPIHYGVREIKSFDVRSRRCLHFLREAEVTTKLNHLGQVVSDQQELFPRGEKRDVLR